MSNFDHWMKFNVGDYLADTMHLTTLQHGIYVLLIMHHFKHGGLPTDEALLRRIAKVPSARMWRQNSAPVMAMWRVENGVQRHTRIDAARAEAQRLTELRRNAGRSGAYKRWGMANAMPDDGNCHSGLACARATPEPELKLKPRAPRSPPLHGGRRERGNGFDSRTQRQSTTSIVRDMIRQEEEEARHAETCACEARARMAPVARDPDDGDDGT